MSSFVRDKGRLRTWSKLKESKAARQVAAQCDPGWDSGNRVDRKGGRGELAKLEYGLGVRWVVLW